MKRREFLKVLALLPFGGLVARAFGGSPRGSISYKDLDRAYESDRQGVVKQYVLLTSAELRFWNAIKGIPNLPKCFAKFRANSGETFTFAFPECRRAINIVRDETFVRLTNCGIRASISGTPGASSVEEITYHEPPSEWIQMEVGEHCLNDPHQLKLVVLWAKMFLGSHRISAV